MFNRPEEKPANLISDRDRDWSDVMNSARDYYDCEPVEANHPLYLLYTSGNKRNQSLFERTHFL